MMENNSTKNLPNKPVMKSRKINFDNRLQQTQLVAASSRGTVLSASDASAANNIFSALDSDHVAKNRETAVTIVNYSREMKDSQLEEGEIPFDQDHQSNYDPDVAFSYIDAKLQNVLGHCQKEFQGEISAENLGSKFGGYGSFLTNHQGSPSEFVQPETLTIVQNSGTHNLPNKGVVKIMTSHRILGGSLPTPFPDIQPQLAETDEKVFLKETENSIVKTEFQNDTSTNKNDFVLITGFRGLKENKAISNGNKTKSTDMKENYSKFGKNAPNNLKRPITTSSTDVCHEWLEKEIMGESGELTLKTSDAYMKGRKEASKDRIHRFSKWAKAYYNKHITDVVQKRLEKVQVGKGILQQAIKGNGAVMGIEKLHILSNRAEGNVGKGKRKNEVNAEVHKSLKKIKTRVAIDGSNNELSIVPRESSKVDSWHEALIHSVKPFVKSKSSTDVQNPLEESQPGTCILSQEIKGNGAAMGMHKYKQREKWKMKQNACNRGEGTPGQEQRKNEGEAGVHKPLKKAKGKLAIHGSNGELSTAFKESSKIDNLHIAASHSTKPLSTIVVAGRVAVGEVAASPANTELEQAAGDTALKEARDLKRTADRLKAIGDSGYDITALYFEAALKYLEGTSLLDPSNLDVMTLYTYAARLFENCASTYERNKEMAAAALAYKCMGVTHMRIVASKTPCLIRDWHELHAAFQEAPLGEFPTISSPYIDKSNNHPMMKKSFVNPSKLDGSSHTQDANAGMEAFRKSEIAFSAATVNSPDGNKGTGKMSEVKRVIDFGFHDIERLLRLVRIAKEAIND